MCVPQVRMFFTEVLNEAERERLCQNMAGHMKGAQLFIQKRAVWSCVFGPMSFLVKQTSQTSL